VLAVVSITLINSTLVTLTGKLTDFEKHHTRSKMARSLARQLFLTQVSGQAATLPAAAICCPRLASTIQ
jgi:hypothetical protein